ncbi:fatty acid desaturase family protein [Novosphingobium sp. 9]|uniref:fatty acid desaturase family protein n=1 Tax=Novosphingobium sp. 9 TaxID=2025349 RepID=UPI0021B5F675|nr:fatty acid desaturase [Novosphingobium sp. 9]
MIEQDILDRPNAPATARDVAADEAARAGRAAIRKNGPEDKAMMRAAAELTRDIAKARPAIYWPDMLANAAVGYATLAGAILASSPWVALACALVSVLTLYRALLFIHELTHYHRDALPGFRFAWNLLVGVPMLIPSYMYEGVHSLHHSRVRYGTSEDPEYLPLALMKPWSLPVFALTSLLLPAALIVRGAILVPLGAVIPPVRRLVWERASSLSINPGFRRKAPEGEFARMVFWQEVGVSVWSIALIAASLAWGWRPLIIAVAIVAAVALLNQVRTLVAHLWENEGEQMSVTEQYLDSVNVPPPGVMAGLWAPVGLRYHALHHLLPSLPYHSLGEAHRRLAANLAPGSTYTKANYPGLMPLMSRLVASTMGRR